MNVRKEGEPLKGKPLNRIAGHRPPRLSMMPCFELFGPPGQKVLMDCSTEQMGDFFSSCLGLDSKVKDSLLEIFLRPQPLWNSAKA
jgi:hypothetical protein